MSSKNFNNDLDLLETQIYHYFNELLDKQEEIVIFDESDLEHESPDDYLEMRNDITGNVFDVHPLKVSKNGILVIESDGSYTRHLIKLQDLGSTQDKISLIELMENSL
jgi:hypothetical protein